MSSITTLKEFLKPINGGILSQQEMVLAQAIIEIEQRLKELETRVRVGF